MLRRYRPARVMGSVGQLLNGVFLTLWALGDSYGFPVRAREAGSPLWIAGAVLLLVSIGWQIHASGKEEGVGS